MDGRRIGIAMFLMSALTCNSNTHRVSGERCSRTEFWTSLLVFTLRDALVGFLIFITYSFPCLAESEIKIGVIIPLSGAMAASGQAFREAALMGLEDSAPSSKLKFSLIFEDDRLESKNAASAASKLISQDHVSALVSTWSYGGSVVAPIAEKERVLHLSVAWASSIARGDFNFLHLMPPKVFVPAIFDVLEKRGLKKISAIVAAEAGSIYSVDELERLAPRRGFTLVSRCETPMDETDFRPVILREMRKVPDVLYVNIFGRQLDTFISQLRSLGHTIPVVVQTGLSTVADLGPYENYWYVSDSYFPTANLEERLVSRIGHRHTLYAANFYDSIRAIVYAFDRAASSGARDTGIKKLIEQHTVFDGFHSIFADNSIDNEGVFSYAPRYYQVKNGRAEATTLEEIVGSTWAKSHAPKNDLRFDGAGATPPSPRETP